MAEIDDLLNSIFDGTNRALYRDFEGWVRSSRRFKAFATSYRTKIRAKLKSVRDAEGMKDLRSELETAVLLLREERFTLEYEKYAASKHRGPDFTVTFKTHTPFNVEVRRMRSVDLDEGNAETRVTKLIGVLCDKVSQMPPNAVNLLWLVAEREVSEVDLDVATVLLRQLAERKADGFFARCDYQSAGDFLKQYGRLSGIALRRSDGNPVWLNPIARHKTPPEIVIAIRRLDRA